MQTNTWIVGGILAYVFLLHRTDATITGWSTPTIAGNENGTGTITIAETQATSKTIETYVATSDATGDITYTLKTADTPFTLSTSGELSITTNLDADTTANYILDIQAVDAANTTGVATITVTVTDTDVAPAFSKTSFTQCIADKSVADTSLITVLATDQDPGDMITHSIDAAGNTNTDFKIDASTGAITVNTEKTLNMTTTATYTLVVKAKDNESPVQTGSTTVFVEVTADGTCNSATAVVVSIITILMTLVLTL